MALTGKNISLPIYHDVNGVRTPFHNLVLHKFVVDSVVMSLGDKITGDVYYEDSNLECSMQEYVVFNDVEYTLVSPPTLLREGLVKENSDLHGMSKYSFEFYHPMHILGNLPFTDVAVSYDEMRYKSHDKTFNWIGKPADFVAKLNKNLENTEWVVVLSSKFPASKLNVLSEVMPFNDNTIADVLKMGYDTWKTPYVVDKLHEGEYYHTDANNNNVDYYTQGKRFVVVFGLPSNEIFDTDLDRIAGNPFVFRFGQGLGLKNNSRNPRNNKIVTRLAGYGSENNIPYGYPQIRWYGNQNATCTIGDSVGAKQNQTINGTTYEWAMSYPIYDGIVGGEWVKLIKHPFTRNHLMPTVYAESIFNKISQFLPDGSANPNFDPTIEIVDYYDAVEGDELHPYQNIINPSSPNYEIKEFEDIKPELGEAQILGATPINADLTDADSWDDTMDDNGNYLQSYFKITLPQLDFDIYACAAITQEMQINMRSGACIGCTFTVQVDWDDYKRNFYDSDLNFLPNGSQRDLEKYPNSANGSITLIVQKDINTFGTLMPNIYQHPFAGDAFVVLGISLPTSYVTSAQERLDNEMKSYMLENNVHYFDYPLKFDEHFLATYPHILNQIRPNTVIRFEFNESILELYVKQLTIKFNEGVLPQYDITLTDDIEVVLNQIGQVAEDVQHLGTLISLLSQQGGKGGGASSVDLAKKLSRIDDDVAQGFITFLKGIDVGVYTGDGIIGDGARIDEHGNAVVNSLYSREFISTPEFRFNRVTVTEGEQWNTNGFGTIEKVENHRVYLHLEDGDIPSVQYGDICRGIYSNIGYADENNTQGYDLDNQPAYDSCGFPTKAQFFTSYFWVTENPTKGADGLWSFPYATMGEYNGNDNTPHPCKNMKFAQYGSFIDTLRQASLYQTSLRHSYIQQLEGVNSWDIQPFNIASRYGSLESLTVLLKGDDGEMHEQTLSGNGLYVQDNVYFGNATLQLDPVTIEDIKRQLANYSVHLTAYTDVIKVDDVGSVIDGLWVENGSGNDVSRQYRVFTAVTVRNGIDLLTIDNDGSSERAGKGKYKIHVQPHGCTCLFDENSTIYITGINGIDNGVDASQPHNSAWYDNMRTIERVWVDLIVDCEGIGSIVETMPISIKHESTPYIIADLTNENASIALSDSGYVGLPIETRINMSRGNDALSIQNIAVTSINGVAPVWTQERHLGNDRFFTEQGGWQFTLNNTTGLVSVTAAPTSADAVTEIILTCVASYSGNTYTRTLSLHITKTAGTEVWEIVPTHQFIKVDKNERFDYNSVGIELYRTDSNGKTQVTTLPEDFELCYIKTRIVYMSGQGGTGHYETVEDPTEHTMALTDSFVVNDSSYNDTISNVRFTLYGANGELLDTEQVPILRDGVGGQGSTGPAGNGISTITNYYIRTLENVTPVGSPLPAGCDGNWSSQLSLPTQAFPWLWKYTEIVYTSDPTYNSAPELIAIYPSTPNFNILEDTAFSSDFAMDAWSHKGVVINDDNADPSSSHYNSDNEGFTNFFGVASGTKGYNSYYGRFRGYGTGDGVNRYVILLQQSLKDDSVNKITQAEWYTLSFVSKSTASFYVSLRGYTQSGEQLTESEFVDTSSGVYVDGNLNSVRTIEFNSDSDWTMHTITFKTVASIAADVCYIGWNMFDVTTLQEVFICMPKLEIGMSATPYVDGDASTVAFPRQGKWEAGKTYFSGKNGERYVDAVFFNGGWFRCKKSHISSTSNQPLSNDWKTYWQQGSYSGFTATGLLLADVAYIDNLGAKLLRTGEGNTPHVEMEGSVVKFFGRLGFANIELAVDDDDVAVFRFFDKYGSPLYDLGPNGIMENFSQVPTTYYDVYYKPVVGSSGIMQLLTINGNNVSGVGQNGTGVGHFYKISEGYKALKSGNSIVSTYNISGERFPSNWHGLVVQSNTYTDNELKTAELSGKIIADGWYCDIEKLPFDIERSAIVLRHFVSGRVFTERQVIFYDSEVIANGANADWYDESGNRYTGSNLSVIMVD